jgi:putative protease
LSKLGDTYFTAHEIRFFSSQAPFYALQGINQLRREACEAFSRVKSHRATNRQTDTVVRCETVGNQFGNQSMKNHPAVAVLLSTAQQIKAFITFLKQKKRSQNDAYRVYIESNVADFALETLVVMRDRFGLTLYIAIPHILRQGDKKVLAHLASLLNTNEFDGCLIRSWSGYAWSQKQIFEQLDPQSGGLHGPSRKRIPTLITDYTLPVWNRESVRFWQERVACVTLSPEQTQKEQRALYTDQTHEAASLQIEKILYGHMPLMISANCICKTQGSCKQEQYQKSQKPANTKLTDRLGITFPVATRCDLCFNILYNSVPLYLPKAITSSDAVTKRISFTIENEAQTLEVLQHILHEKMNPTSSNSPTWMPKHTTAHEYKPVD